MEKNKIAAIHCKTEYMENPVGIDSRTQLLQWQCTGCRKQSAFQIMLYRNGELLSDTGKVNSDSMQYLVQELLRSRDRVEWKIRLWDENDMEGEWSPLFRYEMGLLEMSDWKAEWIDPEQEPFGEGDGHCSDEMNRLALKAWNGRKHKKKEIFLPHQPASYIRKSFEAVCGHISRLYVSAYGMYEVFLNGQRVGTDVLTPGSSNYAYEVKYQVYDVTALLQDGANEIEIVLGDGWYRSTSGVDGDRAIYGTRLAVLAQLETDGIVVVKTDESWEASQDGPLAQNDMQQGEVYDARREVEYWEKKEQWHKVRAAAAGTEKLTAGNIVPIREQESFTGKLLRTPAGETVLDFGQNLAGYVEFELEAKEGQTITLLHGETLDQNRNFTMENFQDRGRHKENGTYQMICYTCKDGKNHYKPRFTIMGFRYVKVITEIPLEHACFIAHAVYSDMKQTAAFTCSNPLVNQLVKNAVWSQKGNFCDIPTDCPTRERAGWTGDAGLFVDTGLTLMDCYPVYRYFLAQCRYGQYPDGRLANIAPPNNRPGFISKMLSASVGWGDACILIPYAMYQQYGDTRILEENYDMMKKWYGFLEKTARKKSLKYLFRKGKYRAYTMESGMNYGEWCEPGSNPRESMRSGNYDVSTAYYAYSGKMLAEIAEALGRKEEAKHYAKISECAGKAYLEAFTENGKINSKRQCQYVRPVQFGLLSGEEKQAAVADLDALVKACGNHLNTGFLTTPHLCEVLADNGYAETAYNVLLQEEAPGWLYEVRKGATTVWETWDGINEAGVPKDSLNHYSYGAIAGWLIEGVAGIRYTEKKIEIRPTISGQLAHARAEYNSPKGKIISAWKWEGEKVVVSITIPCNTEAFVTLPGREQEKLAAGEYSFEVTKIEVS